MCLSLTIVGLKSRVRARHRTCLITGMEFSPSVSAGVESLGASHMKTLTNTIMRGLAALTMAGMGLALTPATAHADFLDYLVAEGTVPGATGAPTITADQLDGNYVEKIAIAGGNFQAT